MSDDPRYATIPGTGVSPEASLLWDQLADVLERFCDAWENGDSPPNLADFIPDDESLRGMARFELIKADMEYREQRGQFKFLEDYLAELPELERAKIPADLLVEDYQIRCRAKGDFKIDLEDYMRQYPHAAPALARWVPQSNAMTMGYASASRPIRLQVGSRIGEFDLLAELGAGSFATVYLARQITMHRLVALKVSADQGHEGQTLAQLDHPHIVRVYDQQTLTLETGRRVRLMYMPYIAAGTLAERLAEIHTQPLGQWNGEAYLRTVDQPRLDRGEAVDQYSLVRRRLAESDWPQTVALLGAQLASALEYAHRQGVLHRDVKPANVLVDRDGSVKLVDFNVSTANLPGVTAACQFGGSLPFMSPEQLEAFHPNHPRTADQLGPPADLFSLAVVLFVMLTGQRPFDDPLPDSDWNEVLDQMVLRRRDPVVSGELRRRLKEAVPGGSELLIEVVLRGLAAEPGERFPTAAAMQRSLEWASDPEIARMMEPRTRPAARWLSQSPDWIGVIAGAGISAVAAGFVIAYNVVQAVPESGRVVLYQCMVVINSIAFTVGLTSIFRVARPIARFLRGRSLSPDPEEASGQLQQLSDRNLMIGHSAALICASLWFLCAFIFPGTLTALGVPLTLGGWGDFIASNVLAGLVSAAYLFTLLTTLAVTAWQPAMLYRGLAWDRVPEQQSTLKRLSRWVVVYQIVALSIPMLSIALLIVRDQPQTKFALVVLSLLGILGCVIQSWLVRRIQLAISALENLPLLSQIACNRRR